MYFIFKIQKIVELQQKENSALCGGHVVRVLLVPLALDSSRRGGLP